MTITALPTPSPSRSQSQDVFDAAIDATFAAFPTFISESNLQANTINNQAISVASNTALAQTAETNAAASATSALAGAGASSWVSGSYDVGSVVWSPINYLTYRATTTGSKPTDPSNDPTNWTVIIPYAPYETNSKAIAQAINLTDAGSGSTGIQIADNTNINFGTNNFSFVWKGSLPDWTPASNQRLLNKYSGGSVGLVCLISTDGKIYLYLNGTAYISTVPTGLVAGTSAHIIASVVRETASANGSVTFYVNGMQLGTVITITAATPPTITNTEICYILGQPTIRHAGVCQSVSTFNRAVTGAESLDLYRNGVNFADKWGSQTILISNGDFASDTVWNKSAGTATITGGVGRFTAAAAYVAINQAAGIQPFKKYIVTYDVLNYSIGGITINLGGTVGTTRNANGTYTEEITTTASTTNVNLYLQTVGASTTLDIDNVSIYEIGATLLLESEGIKLGKWYDSSSNNLDASYPNAGFSFKQQVNTLANKQPIPTAGTGSATLTIAHLLTGIITDTHVTGATATYTLPIADLMDAALPSMIIGDSFEWSLINLSAAAADTATVAAGTNHTVVGLMVVQSANASTGALYGSSGRFRTKKSAINTYITYRIA